MLPMVPPAIVDEMAMEVVPTPSSSKVGSIGDNSFVLEIVDLTVMVVNIGVLDLVNHVAGT